LRGRPVIRAAVFASKKAIHTIHTPFWIEMALVAPRQPESGQTPIEPESNELDSLAAIADFLPGRHACPWHPVRFETAS